MFHNQPKKVIIIVCSLHQVIHASALLPDPVTSQLLPFVCIIVVMLHTFRNDKQKIKAQKGGLTPYK